MKKLTTLLTLLMLPLFATACGPAMHAAQNGEIVYVTSDVELWDTIPQEDLNRPLKDYKGRDILTTDTARGVLRNNEKLSN